MPDNTDDRALIVDVLNEAAPALADLWPETYIAIVDAITTFASEVRAEQREHDASIVHGPHAGDHHSDACALLEKVANAIRNEVEPK